MNSQTNTLSWQIEIPLINNRFILWNVIKGCFLSLLLLFVILGSIFGLATGVKGLAFAFQACLWVFLFIVVISVLTLAMILGNKYPLEFTLDDQGITMKSQSGRAKGIHRLTLILGLLGQNMGAIAAGGSARAGEMFVCPWKDIKSVKLYPGKKVVAAKQNFIQTMYVFCTDENYKEVSDLIMNKAAKSK
jgi:hypothetical protein